MQRLVEERARNRSLVRSMHVYEDNIITECGKIVVKVYTELKYLRLV
jgi:hypothetical protein